MTMVRAIENIANGFFDIPLVQFDISLVKF